MATNNKQHWEDIYQSRKPEELGWFQSIPEVSLQLIKDSGIGKDEHLIDIGGGSSRLVDHLLDSGFAKLSVLDIAQSALAHSKERLGERAASVEWIEQDITSFNPAHTFSLWHDRAVFHFLTESAQREAYVTTLKQSLAQSGYLVIGAFAVNGPEKCSGLEIVQYDQQKLQHELGTDFTFIKQVDQLHTTPGGVEQQFSFFLFQYT